MKGLALFIACLIGSAAAHAAPAVAFFYGAQPPWEELQAFDLVVVDPDHVPDPRAPGLKDTELAAYVAVGEVQPSRAYASRIPPAWLVGENRDWGSRLIDQSASGWPRFFADEVVEPLWAAGYRSFFLDTLDSYHRLAGTPDEMAKQEAGMVEVIREIKRRHPDAQLIFNRGFEILDRVHGDVFAVAAESLFRGYDAGKGVYREVPEADRQWLLGQLNQVRDVFRLPVIAIDYVPPGQRELARETAKRIEALGFIPWVATPDLATLGVGSVEVMPRRVLLLHSPLANEYELRSSEAVRFATMPLNHLGYSAEYADIRNLPEGTLAGRYAGIVVWLASRGAPADLQKLSAWLGRQADDGLPIAIVNQPHVLLETPLGRKLGVAGGAAPQTGGISIVQRAAMIGFERQPRPEPDGFMAIAPERGEPLLTLTRGAAKEVAAAITPWGGYVVFPYAVVTIPDGENRWVIDPFAFFTAALRLPVMPVPDATTESGRRMLMVHMDGDGFASRSELPGKPFAGEALRDRVVRKYPLPMSISIIEAELSPTGLYPALSPQLEAAARDIFRAPNVEMASHSYSHPFTWSKAGGGESGEGYSLAVPGYRFDLQREIEGSIRYIESRLAPPGKKVALFLWTGDCVPGRDALEWAQRVGVPAMNGGDTIATRTQPTLTQVEGLGIERNRLFQVFAPNQNENVYTNNWTGPYYGFERVIETFELTEKPRRLKPIDIYFHTYLTTKRAGMETLDRLFAYAMAKETTPVFASDYTKKVLDFRRIAIARSTAGWRVRGAHRLRTLRLPAAMGVPDVAQSRGVAGFRAREDGTYVHLADEAAELTLGARDRAPRLLSANGRIESYEPTAEGARWRLAAAVPLSFTLANAGGCRVRVDGREVFAARREGDLLHFQLSAHAARPLETICRH